MTKHLLTRQVPVIIAVNSPTLARLKSKYFRKHIKKCKDIPPLKMLNIDEDRLDFSSCGCGLIHRKRSLWNKFQSKVKRKNLIDFQEEYAHYFELGSWSCYEIEYIVYQTDKSVYSNDFRYKSDRGAIASAISHILAWEYASKNLTNDQAAIIVENNVFIDSHRSFTSICMPEEADILYFDKNGEYDKSNSINEEFMRLNSSKFPKLYFVTKTGAQKLLNETLPLPINRTIGAQMFYEIKDNANITYKVFTEAQQVASNFTIYSNTILPLFVKQLLCKLLNKLRKHQP